MWKLIIVALCFLFSGGNEQTTAFVGKVQISFSRYISRDKLLANRAKNSADEEGENLAAEFFETLKDLGISNDVNQEGYPEDDDEEDEEDIREIPTSEVNVFKGRDEGLVGKLAGNVTFTNKELYDSLRERVLESPSTFTSLTSSPSDEEEESSSETKSKNTYYQPPKTVPDPLLTAGEVVTTVLQGLKYNDVPEINQGVVLLFNYSSPNSILQNPDKAPTVEEYSDFLKSNEYNILLVHFQMIISKADYSYDRKKAFFTVRLKKPTHRQREFTSVNFILSANKKGEDVVWLIDSILIRPEGMRRRK